ncbi:MAG: hypothetical protein AVDCRST_MAG20-2045 [uncultured Acidimicrobiales bacterium]|uniref:Cell wall synthesis protein Wag31 n=1 Tax=uncultured Acidimicrobiales bacterium TaxID=310071 RepID=A0A6J4IFM9_9ACTN|nr:MAG: hypothetical protein AVDCRST_MAG20-2045 [uncultured Acidimicrobiales bacterium]
MDISPQLLRDVEFREQRRGYSPNEVDDFLERLAVGVGQLQQQVKEATDRAEEAERRAASGSTDEDGIKRTLVLAQRTADAALEEARQQAAATVAEAEARAAQLVAEAEERAGEAERTAQERAATTVSQAEARVADELVPLLSQRDALHQDVEALRAWAADVRARVADELRQQLAWLDGGPPDPPAPPGVVDLTIPDELLNSTEADRTAPVEVVGGTPPEQGDDATAGVAAEASPGSDGATDEGVASERARRGAVEHGDHGVEGGPLATAAADDPFLAELRRAVTDDEPLGPRDSVVTDASGDPGEDDDLAATMFRRRKRR